MQKLTITKIFTAITDKQGKPLIGSNGRPYTRLAIKTKEYGDKWISGFQNAENARWQIGDVVEVEIEKVNRNGNEYLNFRSLSKLDLLEKRIEDLEKRMAEMSVNGSPKTAIDAPALSDDDFAKDEIDVKDIPF